MGCTQLDLNRAVFSLNQRSRTNLAVETPADWTSSRCCVDPLRPPLLPTIIRKMPHFSDYPAIWALRSNFFLLPELHFSDTTRQGMLGQFFKGFQLLHGVLLALSAAGFFVFWARTRFWLPKYAHILAAIGLIVGVWCVSNLPDSAPVNKEGQSRSF